MSVTTVAGLLERVDAPAPQPRRYSLLDAATVVTEEGRWLSGIWVNGYPSGPFEVFDPCSIGTDRFKEIGAVNATAQQLAFGVYLGARCAAQSIGRDPAWFRQRLQAFFRANESSAVERHLVSGDGLGGGGYLGDSKMQDLGTKKPVEALALLEDEIASVGNGMIHAAPATATAWAASTLIAPDTTGGVRQMRTALGTLVAVGAGYRGADPDSATSPSSGHEWAFASDLIGVRRDDDALVAGGEYPAILDRSINEVTFIHERNYVLAWVGRQDGSDDAHIQAGVLVDRT